MAGAVHPVPGCLSAYQEASASLVGYASLRPHPDAVDCPGMVGVGIQPHQQHIFCFRITGTRSRHLLYAEKIAGDGMELVCTSAQMTIPCR